MKVTITENTSGIFSARIKKKNYKIKRVFSDEDITLWRAIVKQFDKQFNYRNKNGNSKTNR